MATFHANYAFNIDAADLSQYYRDAYDFLFCDNYYFSINGRTYQDSLDIYWEAGGASGWTEFYGNNLLFDEWYGEVYGGTVTAIFEHVWDGWDFQEWWGIQGVSISAIALQNAVYTSSLVDDDALLAATLSGADTFNLSAYGDVARGFGGNDTLLGNGGSDVLYGGLGNDRIYGGSGHDTMDGGAGADVLHGGQGNDVYVLGVGGDTVVEVAGGGTDTVRAAYSHALAGNLENLVLTGTSAISGTGNALANRLTGNGAANVLNGGTGADALLGQGGSDRILGGAGRDTLTGGAGNDHFQFNTRSEAGDVITDFSNAFGNNDQFRISAAGFGGGLFAGTTLAASSFQTRTDNAAQDANDRFIFRTTDKTLWFDADGRGGAAAVLIADLQQTASLTSADILLI